jgi:hypothetical protein
LRKDLVCGLLEECALWKRKKWEWYIFVRDSIQRVCKWYSPTQEDLTVGGTKVMGRGRKGVIIIMKCNYVNNDKKYSKEEIAIR